jgi:N-acetylneuraminic acid mutarotase
MVGTGDFNADGNTDIVWENLTALPVPKRTIWWMNGNAYEGQYAWLEDAPREWSITAVGDLNADGKPDLVWVNTQTGDRSVWYMDGTRIDHYGYLPNVSVAWRIVGTGDFNADGRTDLVWENLTEQPSMRRSIWFMDGDAWTGQYVLLNAVDVPDGWSIAAVGDLNVDGKPDLVWQHATTGERSIWLMNGTSIDRFVELRPIVSDTEWDIAGVLAPVPTPGIWTTKAAMPTARFAAAVGVVNDILYVAGGVGPSTYSTTVEAYDPATDTWTTKAAMPTARAGPTVGVVNGILYIAGGTGPGGRVATVEAYDPATDTWMTKAPMPTARASAAGGVVNGIFYVAGGNVASGNIATVEAYDPVTNTWTTEAAMPEARSFAAAGVVSGTLYIAAGVGTSGYLATVEAYNPTTKTWTTKAAMIPTPRSTPAGGVVSGVLYVAGGYAGVGSAGGLVATVEAYDPATNTWTAKAAMPTARENPRGGVVNGLFYVVGGYATTPLSTLEAFQPW